MTDNDVDLGFLDGEMNLLRWPLKEGLIDNVERHYELQFIYSPRVMLPTGQVNPPRFYWILESCDVKASEDLVPHLIVGQKLSKNCQI